MFSSVYSKMNKWIVTVFDVVCFMYFLVQVLMTANAGASLTVTLDYATIVPIGGNSSIGYSKSQTSTLQLC